MVVAEPHFQPSGPLALAPRAPAAHEAASSLLRGLNREQRRAVTHGGGPALVIAGPGTGKTEVVTRRVAWLIATKRARPREILALTFTDNAAQEMQARVDVLVPYGQADAAIHTFHAFGDRLLREHAFELGLPSDIRLLNRGELILLMREHLFELGLERYRPLGDPARFLGALVDLFARAKDEDVTPARLAADADELIGSVSADDESRPALEDLASARSELAVAFERYGRILAEGGFIDHSDQVALALRLLRDRPATRREIASRFRFVLVDELQDTNRAQLELVLAVAGASRNVMAVGDPDQGIYGFRGARTGNVERFRASFESVATVALRRNYRSLAPIIAVAERVIANNRPVGDLMPAQVAHRRRRGLAPRHLTFATPEAEADGVAAEIKKRVRAGANPSEFAVLVRSNTETDEVARSLRARGIGVDSGARVRLFDVPAVRALVAFIRAVANPDDSLELFTLAAADPYRLRGEHLAPLLNGARRRNRSLFEALTDAVRAGDERLDVDATKAAAALVDHVEAAISISASHTSGEVLFDYLRRSGRLARLAHADDEAAVNEARSIARLCELVRSRSALLAQDRIAFLAPALDVSDTDDEPDLENDQEEAVKVLTVHRAKGLEFGIVFMSGLVDGRFPVRSRPAALSLPAELVADGVNDEERGMAEERRLFYVGLTRARDELYLTSHERGPRGRGRRRPSIFIAEALDLAAASVAGAGDEPRAAAQADFAQVLLPPPEPASAPNVGGPLTLSFSQIDEYLTCPERYRLRYDIGIPTPAHHALSYGTAIHQTIAAFHAAQAQGRTMSDDELIAELRRSWQPDGFLSREHEDARFAAGCDALRRFRAQQIASGAMPPAAVERPFAFRLGRDQIRGRIDRIDAGPDGPVITDYKSSDVRDQKRADTRARDSLQLEVYALAYEAETGDLPRRVQLHFVESGVVGRSEPDRERLEKARDKLTAAADAIRARRFDPKPSAIACGYCPFKTICTASAA